MPTSSNANPTLPSPFQVFHTDPDLDRVERIAKAEQLILTVCGEWHVPIRTGDGAYVMQYFANSSDARVQRRGAARNIVDMEIIEERRRETLHALDMPHGEVLPALRQIGDILLAKGVA